MKKTKKVLASLAIASMVLTMIPFNVLAEGTAPTLTYAVTGTGMSNGHGATLQEVVTEMMSYRGYINPSEIDALREARANLVIAGQDGTLSSAVDGLLTDKVVARFAAIGDTREEAKAAIIKSLLDLQEIQYSYDNDAMESALLKFKAENGRTFRTLFGDDFNIELLYSFILATNDELQKDIKKEVKQNPLELMAILGGSNIEITDTLIKDKLVGLLKTALHDLTDGKNSKYYVFNQKLADIDWNIELLVETQEQVGAVIDPGNAAQKAVAMSVIRSQIQCKINGKTCDPWTPLTLKKSDNKLKLALSVKGIDTGALDIAGWLAWKSDNPAIATVAEDGSSIKAGRTKGTTFITAYRMNDLQVEENELIRIAVTVK
ncbi:hypothetical protein Desor_5151 [Desulfosporosinus orientis DSM 765]|uniref:Ig-like domain-containing protein n=1 Tax=Desulfosporosinus orientis (strain ATCC 19365 / DSM 765 / NCIMB 8382 / VKM B-1628 / Singapore I) TaxID=768706 RepID=G7W732_DESOD|nr:hypothetical protein [Desulfosporosinus orientis]AET70540.1 hypothetical protein Desor_5151 [Desulfosporosinus orientis DSM 765]